MGTGDTQLEPMDPADALNVLRRAREDYEGVPHVRLLRADGTTVIGERDEPPFGAGLDYPTSRVLGDGHVEPLTQYVALKNLDLRRGPSTLIPLDEISALYDFGLKVTIAERFRRGRTATTEALGNLVGGRLIPTGLSGYFLPTDEPVRWENIRFDRDQEVYADLDYFRDHGGELNGLGVTVLVAGLSANWANSLVAKANEHLQRAPNPYVGLCQEREVVIKGYVTFLTDQSSGEADTEEMDGELWIAAIIHEKPGEDGDRGNWALIYLRQNLLKYPELVIRTITQPLHIYGETLQVNAMAVLGATSCAVKVRLAAYVDANAKRPGWWRRLAQKLRFWG